MILIFCHREQTNEVCVPIYGYFVGCIATYMILVTLVGRVCISRHIFCILLAAIGTPSQETRHRVCNSICRRYPLVWVHNPLCAKTSYIAVARGIATKEMVEGCEGCTAILVIATQGMLIHKGYASASTHL